MPSRRNSAPISPGSVHRSAAARIRRFVLAENCRRWATAATSGSAGTALEETSPLALRAPSNVSSSAEGSLTSFGTAFIESVIRLILPFHTNCLKVGVARYIGTGGKATCLPANPPKARKIIHNSILELAGQTLIYIRGPIQEGYLPFVSPNRVSGTGRRCEFAARP